MTCCENPQQIIYVSGDHDSGCAHSIGHVIDNPQVQMGIVFVPKKGITSFPQKGQQSSERSALDFQCLDGEHDAAKMMWQNAPRHFASCSYSFIRVDHLKV